MAEEPSPSAPLIKSNSNSSSSSSCLPLILKVMSKRRTWVCLFVSVYTILISLSWNLLKSVLSWYQFQSSSSSAWPALYASVLLGLSFGLLSMAAALALALPATLVTWITVLVLLAFCGKPRNTLVVEGKKLTAEITALVAKVLIKEGNVVAAICAVVAYFALVRSKHNNEGGLEEIKVPQSFIN